MLAFRSVALCLVIIGSNAINRSEALAADTPPGSAVQQYVEMVPTSKGERAITPSSPARPPFQLPAPVQKALARSGGVDRTTLRAISTQPTLGAQAASPTPPRPPGSASALRTVPSLSAPKVPSPLSAASAMNMQFWLVVATIGSLAFVAGVGFRRRG